MRNSSKKCTTFGLYCMTHYDSRSSVRLHRVSCIFRRKNPIIFFKSLDKWTDLFQPFPQSRQPLLNPETFGHIMTSFSQL